MTIMIFMMTMMVQGKLGDLKIFAFSGIYIEPDDNAIREAVDYGLSSIISFVKFVRGNKNFHCA